MVAVEVATAAADVVTNGEHGTCERNVYAVNIEETNGEHGTCERSISAGKYFVHVQRTFTEAKTHRSS